MEEEYGKGHEGRKQKSYLVYLVERQGEIFRKYFETRDEESFYYGLRHFLEELPDESRELSSEEREIIEVMFDYMHKIEKTLESQSKELL